MSEIAYSSARKLLIQHAPLTTLVPSSNIKIGFSLEPEVYPSISITQVGGSMFAYTGYGTSPHGSKMKRENRIFQVDIYSRSGLLYLQQISEEVDEALISGSGFRKINDNDIFEDSLNAHRKIQTWTFWDNVND